MLRNCRPIACAVGLLLAATPVFSQTTIKRGPVTPVSDVSGVASFSAYCSVCHGVGAKGDGPAAKALKIPPADLTQMTKRHGGKYPADTVRMTIVGEQTMPAHGTREMPMWGPVFRSVEDESVVALRVKNLVDYLEHLQEK